MAPIRNRLILWTAKKHSGKTTSVARLAQIAEDEGFVVAGVLAPSIYHNGRLAGFYVLDLRDKTGTPLAIREADADETESFTFIAEGLKLGSAALSRAGAESVDIIIVDEFGPLELNSGGWRKNVDLLLSSNNAVILLVVREELANQVQQLYADAASFRLDAAEQQSIDTVIKLLKDRRKFAWE